MAGIVVAVQFFKRKKIAPRLFVALLVAGLLLTLADALLVSIVLGLPFFDASTVGIAFGALVACAIWIPYMQQSVRVRNTFVVP